MVEYPNRLKAKRKKVPARRKQPRRQQMRTNELAAIRNVLSLTRSSLLSALTGGEKYDINRECGYPDVITIEMYRQMYDREGIARRVVTCFPEESWTASPEIKEDEESKKTPFEEAWDTVADDLNVYHYLQRGDEVSGIGSFGLLLLGLDDGRELSEAVEGISETGEKTGSASHKLLYLSTFDESVVTIQERQSDVSNPRYGQPVKYQIRFQDASTSTSSADSEVTKMVHWTRVIHLADNRDMSEVYGTPRMKPVYNRLLDVRKILSGSGEMYWKGAFPGMSFEMPADLAQQGYEIDTTAVREEFQNYMNGLQRYMAVTGLQAKMLAPQVVDPSQHIETHMKQIATSLSIPHRILFGSEQAQLASSQDAKNWNKRITKRQDNYLTPMVVRPFVDRLIAFGVLPEVEEYIVDWPDLASPSDEEKAEVAVKRTTALAQYVQGGVDSLVAPRDYFVQILGLTMDEANALIEGAEEYLEEKEDEEEEPAPGDSEGDPTQDPPPSDDDEEEEEED